MYSLGQEAARRVPRQHNEELNNYHCSDIVRMTKNVGRMQGFPSWWNEICIQNFFFKFLRGGINDNSANITLHSDL